MFNVYSNIIMFARDMYSTVLQYYTIYLYIYILYIHPGRLPGRLSWTLKTTGW